jgi:hypothetical protein
MFLYYFGLRVISLKTVKMLPKLEMCNGILILKFKKWQNELPHNLGHMKFLNYIYPYVNINISFYKNLVPRLFF